MITAVHAFLIVNFIGSFVAYRLVHHANLNGSCRQIYAWISQPDVCLIYPDTDSDMVRDSVDNCIVVSNTSQLDTNGDGYGNMCDGDLDQSGAVNGGDLAMLKSVFFTIDADADFNGDGIVNSQDLGLFKQMFFQPPGPSALAE